MATLAPRILRRCPVRSATALASIRASGDRMCGSAPSPSAALFVHPCGGSVSEPHGWSWCRWFRQPVRCGSTAVRLDTDGGFARFAVGDMDRAKEKRGQSQQPPLKKKMSRKAKVNQLKWYRLKAKKKMKSPNPEVRIRYKLEKAKRKEEWLIEKLRKYDVPRTPEPVHDPEILTEEEKFYLKRTGEKKKNYVPVGRRGVFGGVVLNMHLHWKKHETVKVVCKPCRPGQVYEYAEELTRLSKGTVIDIKPNNTIIFYRGKNYVQPKVMSPPDTLSKNKHLSVLHRLWRNIDMNNLLNIQASLLRSSRRSLKITGSMLLYLRTVRKVSLLMKRSLLMTQLPHILMIQLFKMLNPFKDHEGPTLEKEQ